MGHGESEHLGAQRLWGRAGAGHTHAHSRGGAGAFGGRDGGSGARRSGVGGSVEANGEVPVVHVGGRGLHSSTSQLNLSALYGIGGARRGCVARVKGVLGGA